ncbi:hypothetical protein [Pseudoruegeria sp. SK021]|uniref:hypothetical protein n=1 Tax=Pseudoruegeria sp. SK021 TaxID=1933035 RepID=UPI000A22279A|nr:hypothetical protein [Pseudoruegeria sp. SK021]OSP56352.1 hypothetical protein BV911_03450 [Pseudoruegeria sp. SK021]
MFPFFPVVATSDPFNFMRVSGEMVTLGIESQSVIMYRLLGMSGLWAVHPDENERMISEKHVAFTESVSSAFQAVMSGKSPDRVMSAAIEPLRSKTKSNVQRLSQGDPSLG